MGVEIEVVGAEPVVATRVFCIGRNYAAHAAELGNAIPDEPVVFMKPASALLTSGPIVPPTFGAELHHEAEVVVALGALPERRPGDLREARSWIAAIGLGLDLTMRDVQRALKAKGLPWERAKAFDGAAPIGALALCPPDLDLGALHFEARVDGARRQHGDTALMLFSIPTLVLALSEVWQLQAGDLIFTGTPAGVGPLHSGEHVELEADWCPASTWLVAGG